MIEIKSMKIIQANRNIPYFIVVAVLFFFLKYVFSNTETDNLTFLLYPTNKLLELFTGTSSVYISEVGYFYQEMNITVEKSCSGFNFWILCFALFSFLMINNTNRYKVLFLFLSLIISYVMTIFVNASRIFVSLIVCDFSKSVFPLQQHLIHEAVGVIIYLSFLILVYLLLDKFLKNKQFYAKLS